MSNPKNTYDFWDYNPKSQYEFWDQAVFFLIFASTNNPYIYDRTIVTAKDRVAYVCRQSNHRYRSAAGGQKYAFKDDTCVKETAVITPDNWMEWVV